MKKIGLGIIIIMLLTCSFWVLPETQKARCLEAMHGFHLDRVESIKAMMLPTQIESELIEYSKQTEADQGDQYCQGDVWPAQNK